MGMAALTYQAAVLTALLMMFATNGRERRCRCNDSARTPTESRTDVTGEASPLTALGRLLIRSATLTWLAAAGGSRADRGGLASPPGLVFATAGLTVAASSAAQRRAPYIARAP